MLNIPSSIESLIGSQNISTFTLAEFLWSADGGGELRLTDAPHTITITDPDSEQSTDDNDLRIFVGDVHDTSDLDEDNLDEFGTPQSRITIWDAGDNRIDRDEIDGKIKPKLKIRFYNADETSYKDTFPTGLRIKPPATVAVLGLDSDITSIAADGTRMDFFYEREYTPDGNLSSVSPPNITGEVARDLFTIELNDHAGTYRDRLLAESTGVPVSVELAFIDTDGVQVPEILDVFHGKISTWQYDVQGNEPKVAITASGPLAKLDMVTNRLTTEDSQKAVHPNDTCFDHSFNTANEASLTWGPAGGD